MLIFSAVSQVRAESSPLTRAAEGDRVMLTCPGIICFQIWFPQRSVVEPALFWAAPEFEVPEPTLAKKGWLRAKKAAPALAQALDTKMSNF